MRPRSLLRLTALVALPVALTSCGDEDVTALERQVTGVFVLAWVNGEPPPYQLGEQEGYLVEVFEGRVTLREDKTCEYGHTFQLYSLDDSTTRTESEMDPCTWSVSSGAVHLSFPPSGHISGIFSRDALWFDYLFDVPLRFVYERAQSQG